MSSSPINNRSSPPPYYGSTPTAPLLPAPRAAEVWQPHSYNYYSIDNSDNPYNEVQIDTDTGYSVNGLGSSSQAYHNRRQIPSENGRRPAVEDDDSDSMSVQFSSQVKDCCRSTFTLQNVLNKFPIVKWLPKYRGDTFTADLVAGMTVGLTVIPQGLAYASIANLPPQYGLYSAFMGCFIYCFLGTSKDITLGPTAIMSLMTATFGGSPVPNDATYAIILTLMSGVVQLVLGILKLGILVNFISYPVINAFTSAAAITIAFGQVKYILGLKNISREFLHMVYEIFAHIPDTRVWDMAMGIVSLVAVILLKKLRQIKWGDEEDPDRRVSIPVLIFRKTLWLCGTGANAIIVICAAGVAAILESYGHEDAITITGNITAGMPSFSPPKFELFDHQKNVTYNSGEIFSHIGAGLFIVPLLGLVETMAIGKAFARANNYKIDPTQELLAIGTANIVSSFVKSYPITGSFSRTAVNSQSGVRTPLSGIWTGGLVILALCVLTPWFYYIPKSALAAVIIAAVIQMVDYKIILTLWRANKWDLVPLVITFVTSLTVGIEYGILIGIGVSIFMLLYPTARPKITYEYYSSAIKVTPMQGLNFPASEHLEIQALEEALRSAKPRNIILNLEHTTDLDYTAVQALKSLNTDCLKHDISLVLTNAQPKVKRLLKAAAIKDLVLMHANTDALEELNVQGPAHSGKEEAEPFMSKL